MNNGDPVAVQDRFGALAVGGRSVQMPIRMCGGLKKRIRRVSRLEQEYREVAASLEHVRKRLQDAILQLDGMDNSPE